MAPTPTTPETDPAYQRAVKNIQLTSIIAQLQEVLMAGQAELLAKIAELQAGQTELVKDVRRLIAEGNTAEAISKLDTLIQANEQLDAEVEGASPEPATPPVEEQPPPVEETPAPPATPETPVEEDLDLSGSGNN